MTHPGDGELQALVDGELPADARAVLESHLRACTACAAELARLRLDGERTSALLGLADVPAPILAAQAEFHRRRRAGRGMRAAGAVRRALPRAAVLVLALAGAAAAAVVPGSPVREWVGGLGIAPRAPEPEALPAPSPPPVAREAEPAPRAVSLAPVDGRIRVVVTGASPELRVRVRLTDAPLAEVTATGAAAGARFRTAPGRIEIVGAGPGEAVVHLPAAARAHLEVNGRVVAALEGGVLRALAPRAGGSAAEPVFRAGG
jgi:hypothetical protein